MAHAAWIGQSRPLRRAAPPAFAPIFIALSFALPGRVHAAGPLPSGGQFVAGTGSINGNPTSLTINQTSSRGIIDWTSFSIGNGNHVSITNGTGATLNRVTGGDPSSILGTLSATGSVYLINPQGIVIGTSGVISTGGRFVASTLDTDNTAFMNGGPLTFSGNSDAEVVNLGKIGSSGGDVVLIASKGVTNVGGISAPQGSAELAVGQQVLLQDSSSSRQVFVQAGSGGTVLNQGAIYAAQVSLQAADGNVFALTGNHEAIRATGTATRDGHIWLVAESGSVKLSGPTSTKNVDGSSGTVDTNAGNIVFQYTPTVLAGIWNITTPSIKIDNFAATSLSRSLNAGTSINLQTTGASGQTGDINVASNIGWSGAASLSLGAYHTVNVVKRMTIKNQGSGNLTLRADATGIDNGGSVLNLGTADWSNSTGTVSLLYDMNGTYAPGKLLGNAAWTPATGSGLQTQITGYQLVNSIGDLENISQNLAGNYALGKDLDGGANFTPIGNASTPFSGQFDGMYHTIDNILIMPVYSTPYASPPLPAGLFGVIGSAGVVRNLSMTNGRSSPINYGYTMSQGGLLAGINQGHIANVFVSGSLTALDYMDLGGLVGQNVGLIERSAANVAVSARTSYLGGLVGENDGTITQSYSTGSVQGINHPSLPGGLVAYNTGTISQSFVTGPITGDWMTTPYLGALTGANSGTVTADNYWNVETTGLTPTHGGGAPASNGLTTAQMSNPASFVGWDFGSNGAWAMPAGATHPVLRWQVEHPAGE
ncbi:two-partner secretion domain-containing protein [Trinickia symbiotica]|uniref:Filamentous hemagglutinin n=5 Tax=Trinickia symbiotica TaxID=863227 RepID=A0A2N7WWW7_9BURK|nr:filamentous hemagglutinin N-terminal domain-containing protein [Trinickia symbiotica]PMS33870.1 filamentous hemagglutinin [Trinickia symbiotica]